ncbi:OB-fold domain-containing protein [Mycobacterium sp. SMC-8]|uniref:thiolase C-terminal domain-containing protein n=1 Tax=Mycobacterium sp. SMC-8 TaxID=2857060 RepID=UPI0021B4B566|nr:OB-fold domain-containing protein [Mycobacterium sp. SMC-8]UXA11545.1 OB-fold domain-containing protein [Mycobacterium sp. SMC-8]
MTYSSTGRKLPQPTLASSEFWASGADGVLRIARCGNCSAWLHPKPPICNRCHSRHIEMAPTSGKARILGFTRNEQQWLPSMTPPYVIAVVALHEDTSVHLTTNIVDYDPSTIGIGDPVRVTFERGAEDIWIPLFEPDPDGESTAVLPEPEDTARHIRQPVSDKRFEDQVLISGVGQSQVGRRLMVDPLSLTVDACLAAIADAGLNPSDIDGLATYPGAAPAGMSEGGVMALEEALRLRPTWVNGGGETPGQTGSIVAGMLAVAAGLCRHVLCFRTVWESSYSALTRSGKWLPSDGPATDMHEFRAPFGAMSAANWIACNASHYLHRYGDTRETLGWIALTERTNAGDNPEAVYREPLSMDDYLSARMVSTPLGLYDCDVPVDGAVAVIISARETAADLRSTPVLVEAVGTQILERLSWDQGTFTHLPQSLGPSRHLWTRTQLRPDDVDVALLYDGFTFNALSWLEGLGFCGLGEASDFIDQGRGIAVSGRLPLNPHGGQLSAGRLHGYGFMREAVLQLRGQAPGRQVANPKTAVVSAGGGVPSGAILLRVD